MDAERPWSKDLRADLEKVLAHYTPERYPANVDTQRDYDQALHHLGENWSDRLEAIAKEDRHQYAESYPDKRRAELDADERKQWEGIADTGTLNKDYWDIRDKQLPERQSLDDGTYRQSERFQEGLNQRGEEHTQRQERADRAFDQVTSILDERFGLTREREHERTYDHER